MTQVKSTSAHAIIIIGIPGSGKTTFATKFADTFAAPLIRIDEIIPHTSSLDSAYSIVTNQLAELTKTRHTIVLDIDSMAHAERTKLAKTLAKYKYQPLFVWVQTDVAIAKRRSRNNYTDLEFDKVQKSFVPPRKDELPVVISGRHMYHTQARAVLKRLSADNIDVNPPAHSSGKPLRASI